MKQPKFKFHELVGDRYSNHEFNVWCIEFENGEYIYLDSQHPENGCYNSYKEQNLTRKRRTNETGDRKK